MRKANLIVSGTTALLCLVLTITYHIEKNYAAASGHALATIWALNTFSLHLKNKE